MTQQKRFRRNTAVVLGRFGEWMRKNADKLANAQTGVSYDITLYSGDKFANKWYGCERLARTSDGGVKFVCYGKVLEVHGGAIVVEEHR